jgi:hypothetical protein
MTQVILNLPDGLAQQAMSRAALTGGMEDYLAGLIARDVAGDPEQELRLMESLADEDVLALADLRLTPEEDRRLHELLELNSEGRLTAEDERELNELMKVHDEGMLKKAMGWAEAVRRKLRPPISS